MNLFLDTLKKSLFQDSSLVDQVKLYIHTYVHRMKERLVHPFTNERNNIRDKWLGI